MATSDTVADGYKIYQDHLKMVVLLELLLPLLCIVVDRSLCSAHIDGCCMSRYMSRYTSRYTITEHVMCIGCAGSSSSTG